MIIFVLPLIFVLRYSMFAVAIRIAFYFEAEQICCRRPIGISYSGTADLLPPPDTYFVYT